MNTGVEFFVCPAVCDVSRNPGSPFPHLQMLPPTSQFQLSRRVRPVRSMLRQGKLQLFVFYSLGRIESFFDPHPAPEVCKESESWRSRRDGWPSSSLCEALPKVIRLHNRKLSLCRCWVRILGIAVNDGKPCGLDLDHDAVTLEEDVIVIAQRNIPLDILP